jgi:hypothetical protein
LLWSMLSDNKAPCFFRVFKDVDETATSPLIHVAVQLWVIRFPQKHADL